MQKQAQKVCLVQIAQSVAVLWFGHTTCMNILNATDNEYDDSFSASEKEISLVKLQKC